MVTLDDVLIASERAALIFEVMSLAALLILYFGRPVTRFGAAMRANYAKDCNDHTEFN